MSAWSDRSGNPGATVFDTLVSRLVERLPDVPGDLAVAVSGGRDSALLLRAAAAARSELGGRALRACHVDHGLHAAAADWAEAVRESSEALGVPCTVLRVDVEEDGGGLEAAARDARHGAFAQWLGADETLLLAHHRDDQIETLLLRLIRGSGPAGLAGMPDTRPLGRGRLLRPWLAVPGAALAAAAAELELRWIEDPANEDPAIDRVFLRNRLLPQLEARWPGVRAAIGHSAQACADVEAVLSELQPEVPARGAPLALEGLLAAPGLARRRLRGWLASADVRMPPRARLEEFLRQLRVSVRDADEGRRGARAEMRLGDVLVRAHGDAVHLVSARRARPTPRRIPARPGRHDLGCGILVLEAAEQGLRCDLEDFDVRFREGGERVRVPARGSVTLKKLLQEAGVPPWERDRLPLLCAGEDVLCVPSVTLCEGAASASGADALSVRWEPASDAVGDAW